MAIICIKPVIKYSDQIHASAAISPQKQIDIFVNCSWVNTRRQQYSTHLHTTTHRTTQLIWEESRLCVLYPGICLTTEEKARKTLSQGSRSVPVGRMQTEGT